MATQLRRLFSALLKYLCLSCVSTVMEQVIEKHMLNDVGSLKLTLIARRNL